MTADDQDDSDVLHRRSRLEHATLAEPPPFAVRAALAVCVVGAVMVIPGAWRTGIWTDEPAHVLRYENLQQHGWYLLDDDFDGGQPGSWITDQYVYAPVATQLTHAVNRVLGIDAPGALATSAQAYGVRHVFVGVLGLLCVLAVGLIARRLLGSWRWGAVSAATLMAIPMWPGLSMFDFKDVPAATGYTLVTLGLVELLLTHGAGTPLGRFFLPAVSIAAGLVLSAGTRPGLWPGLVASMAFVALLPRSSFDRPRGTRRGRLAPIVLGCAVAYAALLLAYPSFFAHPQDWLLGSLVESADYAGSPHSPAAGSWVYIPSRVVIVVMPPVLLLIGVAGCLASLPRRLPKLTPEVCGWIVVALQALLLPVLAIVRQSSLSDDLRQLAFACPAVALLLTAGWRRFATDVGNRSRMSRAAVGLVWSAALVVPTAVQVQLFPYAYSYAAPQAAPLGAVIENDYGRLSLRELLPQIPRGEFVVCHPALSEQGDAMRYLYLPTPAAISSTDCRTDPFGPMAPFDRPTAAAEEGYVDDTFLALVTRGEEPGRNCQVLGTVERRRYFAHVVMSTVARCRLVLNPYPDSGVVLDPDGSGAEFLLGGWTSHPLEPGVRLREQWGSLGFALPDGWDAGGVTISIAGESPGVPEVRVNNQPVPATGSGDGWLVEADPEAVAAMGDGRLVVSLAPQAPGEPLVLTQVDVHQA